MQLHPIDANQARLFNNITLDYLKQDAFLEDFITGFPGKKTYEKIISEKKIDPANRQVLVQALQKQYAQYKTAPGAAVEKNIAALADANTYTVTSGQQVHVLGGPLYVYFKALTAILLCKKLAGWFPDKKFVPVFWMAGEDHDFEEIAGVPLFGNSYTAARPEGYHGPVGRMPADIALPVFEQLLPLFERDEAVKQQLLSFKEFYAGSSTLNEAFFKIMHHLLGEEGLVILNPDDAALKRIFLPVIEGELKTHKAKAAFDQTTAKLVAKYKAQATAREVNLFYISDKERLPIHKTEDGAFQAGDKEEKTDAGTMEEMAQKHPENFSPNVVLRPLYQETILPNISYVGGPGELAYWMQLKGVFDAYGEIFPVFEPRLSFLPVPEKMMEKISTYGWSTLHWLTHTETELVKEWLEKNADNDTHEPEEKKKVLAAFDDMAKALIKKDKQMEQTVQVEYKNLEKSLEKISDKWNRLLKSRNEHAVKQVENYKQRFFDPKNLAERSLPFFTLSQPLNALKQAAELNEETRAFVFSY